MKKLFLACSISLGGMVIAPYQAIALDLDSSDYCHGAWSVFNRSTCSTLGSFCTLVNTGICSTNPADTLNTDSTCNTNLAPAYQAYYNKPLPTDTKDMSHICDDLWKQWQNDAGQRGEPTQAQKEQMKGHGLLCAISAQTDSINNIFNMFSVYNIASCRNFGTFITLTKTLNCNGNPSIATILRNNPYCANSLLAHTNDGGICGEVLEICKANGNQFPKMYTLDGLNFYQEDLAQMWGTCHALVHGWTPSNSQSLVPGPQYDCSKGWS